MSLDAMKQALEALEDIVKECGYAKGTTMFAIFSLRVAIEQAEKPWQGLTDEQLETMAEKYVTNCYFDTLKFARAIEARLKEKNDVSRKLEAG